MPDTACALTRPEISAYIDGETDPRITIRVRDHLEDCPACTGYEASLRTVKRVVSLQPAIPVPELHDRVMERVAGEVPLVLRRRERHRLGRLVAVAATATILFLAGAATLWRSGPSEIASAMEITGSVQAAGTRPRYLSCDVRDNRARLASEQSETREFLAQVWFDAPERFRYERSRPHRISRWPVAGERRGRCRIPPTLVDRRAVHLSRRGPPPVLAGPHGTTHAHRATAVRRHHGPSDRHRPATADARYLRSIRCGRNRNRVRTRHVQARPHLRGGTSDDRRTAGGWIVALLLARLRGPSVDRP